MQRCKPPAIGINKSSCEAKLSVVKNMYVYLCPSYHLIAHVMMLNKRIDGDKKILDPEILSGGVLVLQ